MADKFVASRPQLPEGYNLLGTINSARGELNKAKESYEKGLGLKNPNVFAAKALEKINSELKANEEIYNDGESPIAVDADQLTEEEGGNIADDTGIIAGDDDITDQLDALNANGDSEDDDSVLHGLETTPPIEQALTGEDGDFWEDFDDDPNAEAKPITEEDDSYDENEENSDLMSMMTPDAAEGEESLESGLSQDEGGFDFSDFEDAPAASAEEPAASESPAVSPADADSQSATAAEAAPENIPEAYSAPAAAAAKPEPQPAEEAETLSQAQKLMDDLKQQQKEMEDQKKEMEQQQKDLELQQREFALQQKELADELKQQNEEMIQEAVGKAVDEAVEEKLSAYDLQPAQEPEEEPVVEEPAIEAEAPVAEEPSEEIPSDDFDLQLYDEDFGDTDFVEDTSSEESSEVLAEEAALDGLSETETETEVEAEPEPEEEAEPEPEIEIEPEAEEEKEVEEETETEEAVSEETADDGMLVGISAQEFEELTSDPFVTVDEIVEEIPAPDLTAPAAATTYDDLSDENFVTADDMVDKIGRILNDDKTAKDYAAELELFKKLRTLSSFLPEKDKNSYDCCRMRMVIEYIIQKMSGKPGLLITAESLIKSGVLGEEYNRQLEDCCDEELSNDLIKHVISDMKKLAEGLEDEFLCKALCVSADAILEQIALIDQQVAIF